jgi:hypothetical protein
VFESFNDINMACPDGYLEPDDALILIAAQMVTDDLLLTEDAPNAPSLPVDERLESSFSSRAPIAQLKGRPLSYIDAFKADLKIIEDIDGHEARLYKRGFNPATIRHNIQLTLRTIKLEQHL